MSGKVHTGARREHERTDTTLTSAGTHADTQTAARRRPTGRAALRRRLSAALFLSLH